MVKVFLIGNLTRDPELSKTQSGVSVCKMNVAVNRKMQDVTDYFTVIAWRAVADNCGEYLGKGSKVAVYGELQNRSYETKNGEKRYVTEIVADEVSFLSWKQADDPVKTTKEVSRDELPFKADEKYVQEDLPF